LNLRGVLEGFFVELDRRKRRRLLLLLFDLLRFVGLRLSRFYQLLLLLGFFLFLLLVVFNLLELQPSFGFLDLHLTAAKVFGVLHNVNFKLEGPEQEGGDPLLVLRLGRLFRWGVLLDWSVLSFLFLLLRGGRSSFEVEMAP